MAMKTSFARLPAMLASALFLVGCISMPGPSNELVLIGAGAHPCSLMTTATPRDPSNPPVLWGTSWTTGYLRAYFDERFGTSFDPLFAFQRLNGKEFDVSRTLVKWCTKNPGQTVRDAALAISSSAVAGSGGRDPTNSVVVLGSGEAPCPAVFADEDWHKQGHLPSNWMYGYMRGRYDARFGEGFDPLREAFHHHGGGLLPHIDSVANRYCTNHPESSLWQVSMETSRQLLRECEARGDPGCRP